MYIDWFFTNGKAHHVCEDYAIDGNNCAIISDGCSSSKHTDVGARLLAHSARILLSGNLNWRHNDLGKAAILKAAKLFKDFNMGYECLYATLLTAKVMESGEISTHMYGDGIIIAISNKGIETMEVSYTNNMPYYLAYSMDPKSMEAYKRFENEVTIVHMVNGEIHDTLVAPYDYPIEYTFDPTQYHTVLISTDGLSSFEDKQNMATIPLSVIANQVADFKVMKGAFIKRRLARVIEDLAVKKIFPLDDVGMAGIHLEEGERKCLIAI